MSVIFKLMKLGQKQSYYKYISWFAIMTVILKLNYTTYVLDKW